MSDLMAQGIARSISPSAEPVTNLTAAERELDMQTTRLNELTNDLAVRLERILRIPNDTETAMARPELQMDSDVSQIMMQGANRIRHIANRVEDILRRVDL